MSWNNCYFFMSGCSWRWSNLDKDKKQPGWWIVGEVGDNLQTAGWEQGHSGNERVVVWL